MLLKETSVAGYIGLQDLTKGGDIIKSRTYSAFMPLIAVAVIYLFMVMVFSRLVRVLERRLQRSEHYNMEKPLIQVQNLGKKFGDMEVLKDISVDIYKGDVVCV